MVHETYEGVGRGFVVQLLENMYRFSLGAVAGGELILHFHLRYVFHSGENFDRRTQNGLLSDYNSYVYLLSITVKLI